MDILAEKIHKLKDIITVAFKFFKFISFKFCNKHTVDIDFFISNYSLLLKCSQSVRLECGRLGVPIPATKDLSHKNMSNSSTAKRSATGVSVTGPRR